MKNQFFNRRTLFFLLAIVTCLGFTAMSYGAATVSVDPATLESPAAGEQFTVDITIAGGAGIAGYQVTVNFDSTALSYVSIAYQEDYLEKPTDLLKPVTVSDNSVRFLAIGGAPDGDHTLATITFEVVEAKESAITLSDIVLSDAASDALEVTTADGAITVPATDEPTDPTDEPTDPTDEPTDPTDEPTDPTDEPTDPTDEPTDPD